MYVEDFCVPELKILPWPCAGGDRGDPFAAQEEEKPKQEVPQVSSPQPASPTGRVVRDRHCGLSYVVGLFLHYIIM